MRVLSWIVDKANSCGHAKAFIGENGVCPYSGKTKDDYVAEGYSALNDIEFSLLVEQWENNLCGDWKEITEKEYEDMLNVLPPLQWHNGGFFISEMYTGNITNFYQKLNGRYYTSFQRVSTPRDDILKRLQVYVRTRKEKE